MFNIIKTLPKSRYNLVPNYNKYHTLVYPTYNNMYSINQINKNINYKNYVYSKNKDSIMDSLRRAYIDEKLENYSLEINLILYSISKMNFENECGFFVKYNDKTIFFKNEKINIDEINIKSFNLDSLKNK